MTAYSLDELRLEQEMADLGAARVHAKFSSAKQYGRLSVTVAGRALLRRYAIPVAQVLTQWVETLATKRQGDVQPEALLLIQAAKPAVVALLSTQVVVDEVHRPRTVAHLAIEIGRAVEDELRCKHISGENPGLWKDLKKRTARSRPTSKRRRVFYFAQQEGLLLAPWSLSTKSRVGLACIDAILLATNLIEIEMLRTGKRTQHWAHPTRATVEWLEKAEEKAATATPMYLPMLDEPLPWTGPEGGGYHTDLLLRRPIARFRSPKQQQAFHEPGREQPETVYAALNTLQRVSWSVDPTMMTLVDSLWDGLGGFAGLPPRDDEPLPEKPEDIATNDESRKAWRLDAVEVYRRNHERRAKRAGVAMHRITGLRMAEYEKFYLPHRLDFRGRAYPIPYMLQPQGPDICRGLLRFNDGVPLTDKKWLMIHGANCFGVKGTLAEREAWGRGPGTEIAKPVAEDPYSNKSLWIDADDPWQFVAWCLEVGENRDKTHLPVAVDASNNGLQILSVLGGDRDLARFTNVLPSERPQDIYQEVASRTSAKLEELAELDDYARGWVTLLPTGLPRAAAKRPVMTLPYGVSTWSAQEYLRDWAKAAGVPIETHPCGKHKATHWLASLLLDQVREVCGSAVTVMSWLRDVSDVLCEAGVQPAWTAPTGWPVVQYYENTERRELKAPLAATIANLTIREGTGKPNAQKNRQGISPNFVHSLDAAVMATALARWTGPVAAVHDSFSTLGPLMPSLLTHLREAFVACLVLENPLERLAEELRARHRLDIPDPPERKGEIKPEEVMQSEYLFS